MDSNLNPSPPFSEVVTFREDTLVAAGLRVLGRSRTEAERVRSARTEHKLA